MRKKIKNQNGFTLIELIVVIAILGILAVVAVPRLSGFRESARAQANETNAKLMTNIAQMIQADTGAYPTNGDAAAGVWPTTFSEMTVEMATVNEKVYLSQDIEFEGEGDDGWTYDESTGIVTVTGEKPADDGGTD